MLEDVAIGGAGDARKVDAPVIFVVLVFDGGDGVVENLGSLLPGHQDAALDGEAADELAIVGVNFGDYVGAIRFQRANFGEVAFVDEEQGRRRRRAQWRRGAGTRGPRGQSVSSRASAK